MVGVSLPLGPNLDVHAQSNGHIITLTFAGSDGTRVERQLSRDAAAAIAQSLLDSGTHSVLPIEIPIEAAHRFGDALRGLASYRRG